MAELYDPFGGRSTQVSLVLQEYQKRIAPLIAEYNTANAKRKAEIDAEINLLDERYAAGATVTPAQLGTLRAKMMGREDGTSAMIPKRGLQPLPTDGPPVPTTTTGVIPAQTAVAPPQQANVEQQLPNVTKENRSFFEQYVDSISPLVKEYQTASPARRLEIDNKIREVEEQYLAGGNVTESDLKSLRNSTFAGLRAAGKKDVSADAIKAYAIAGATADLVKAGIAIDQIRQAEAAIPKVEPTPPQAPNLPVLRADPRLQNALVEAQGFATREDPLVQQARQQAGQAHIRRAFQTGQQLGVPGAASMANVASLDAANMMASGAERDRADRLSRRNYFNNLLGQRLRESEAINRSAQQSGQQKFLGDQKNFYGFTYPQYQYDRETAVGLGQAGRENLGQVLTDAPTRAYNLAYSI